MRKKVITRGMLHKVDTSTKTHQMELIKLALIGTPAEQDAAKLELAKLL